MKSIFFSLILVVSSFSYSQTQPTTKSVPTSESKYNVTINDDYSWLEQPNSIDVSTWVDAQNQFTNSHFEAIKKRYSLENKIKEYDELSTNGLPTKKGRYFYSMYRKDKDKPGILFYRKGLKDLSAEVFNPYKIYKSPTTTIAGYYPSRNSQFIAIQLTIDGSDRKEMRFADLNSLNPTNDVLKDIKFSNVVWKGDRGVYYKRNTNKNTIARDSTYQIYYHNLGQKQEEDELIYDATQTDGNVTFFKAESKMFIVETNEKGVTYRTIDLNSDSHEINDLIVNDTTEFNYRFFKDNTLYFSTKDYDWGEIRCKVMNNQSEAKVLIPQIYNHLLCNAIFLEKYIVCEYRTLGRNYISVYDYEGKFIRKFDAPLGCDFNIKFYNSETEDLFVSFYSYVVSFQNFKLNIRTGDINLYYNDYIIPKPTIFPLDYFETKVITYKSRDNKDVPITIVHKKGMKLDGSNPTLLSAYGGYGSVTSPHFDSALLCFLDKGGIFARAEIRGSGEKGLKWHRDGKGLKKMNTFNDFIDAAEFLIKEKYTSPSKLAITGGSHGGLVVGVAMTQRPDLFKVALPDVGVFDMVKFEEFTVGKYSVDEFGSVSNVEDFKNLYSYSPYHNIKPNVDYPITLIITGENDDRAVPFHSYKFAAKLQNNEGQKNPIYLKTEYKAGHSGKISNYQEFVQERAEFYSFLMYHLMGE